MPASATSAPRAGKPSSATSRIFDRAPAPCNGARHAATTATTRHRPGRFWEACSRRRARQATPSSHGSRPSTRFSYSGSSRGSPGVSAGGSPAWASSSGAPTRSPPGNGWAAPCSATTGSRPPSWGSVAYAAAGPPWRACSSPGRRASACSLSPSRAAWGWPRSSPCGARGDAASSPRRPPLWRPCSRDSCSSACSRRWSLDPRAGSGSSRTARPTSPPTA
jgi:hypothetical protein